MSYYNYGRPHTWRPKFETIAFNLLNAKILCKEIEPHWNAESPLQRIGPPGHIPEDRFTLLPDWANRHQCAMKWHQSKIMV